MSANNIDSVKQKKRYFSVNMSLKKPIILNFTSK